MPANSRWDLIRRLRVNSYIRCFEMFLHDEYVVKYNETHLLFTTQRILSSSVTLRLERLSRMGCGKS